MYTSSGTGKHTWGYCIYFTSSLCERIRSQGAREPRLRAEAAPNSSLREKPTHFEYPNMTDMIAANTRAGAFSKARGMHPNELMDALHAAQHPDAGPIEVEYPSSLSRSAASTPTSTGGSSRGGGKPRRRRARPRPRQPRAGWNASTTPVRKSKFAADGGGFGSPPPVPNSAERRRQQQQDSDERRRRGGGGRPTRGGTVSPPGRQPSPSADRDHRSSLRAHGATRASHPF